MMNGVSLNPKLGAHPAISAKGVVRNIRECFKLLEGVLKKDPPAAKELHSLLNEVYPNDFKKSLKLLKEIQPTRKRLEEITHKLAVGHLFLQPIHKLQTALQKFDSQLFGTYWRNKSSKDDASYCFVKFPFLSWCLQQALELYEKKDVKSAQEFWSLCSQILPADFHQGLNFTDDEKKVKKVTDLIREQLNAKEKMCGDLDIFLEKIKKARRQELTPLLKKIGEFQIGLEQKYDSHFYADQIQNFERFLKHSVDLGEFKAVIEKLIINLKSLHRKSLDYEIETLQNELQIVERILSKIPYDLEKGLLPEGLLARINPQQFIANKQLIVKILTLCLWIEENKEGLVNNTHSINSKKLHQIDLQLISLFPQNVPKKVPVKIQLFEDPDFESKLSAEMFIFSNHLKANEVDKAAEAIQSLVKSLKCFRARDDHQQKNVIKICEEFCKQHAECLKSQHKDKSWQIIKNALKSLSDPQLIKKKGDDPLVILSTNPGNPKFNELLQEIQTALDGCRISQAAALCTEWVPIVKKISDEELAKGHEFLVSFKKEASNYLIKSTADYENRLQAMLSRLYEAAENENEFMGKAYQDIQSPLAAQRAIKYFEMALKEKKSVSLLMKLGSLYKEVRQIDDMWRVYHEACQLQPDYFVAINRTACEYFVLGKWEEMIALYMDCAKFPFIPSKDHFDERHGAQISVHRNLIAALMHHQDFVRAFPLVMNLKAHLEECNAYFYRDNLDEIVLWLTAIPEEVSHFTPHDFNELLGLCNRIETRNACEFKIYQSYVSLNDYQRATEYKWKILAGIAVTSRRSERMLVAMVYCQNSHQEAIGVYKSIIAENPSYLPAYFRLYFLYRNLKDTTSAKELRNKILALKLEPFCLTDSLEQLIPAVTQQEIDPDFYCRTADIFLKEGDDLLAEKLYRKALEIDPKHKESLFGMASLFQKAGKIREAKIILKLIINHDDDFDSIAFHYYLHLVRMGTDKIRNRERDWYNNHFPEACEHIKEELKQKALKFLASVNWKLAALEPERALQYIDRVLSMEPDNYKAHTEKAKIISSSAPHEAVTCVKQALLSSPMFYQEGYEKLRLLLQSYTCAEVAFVYQVIGEDFFKKERIEEAILNLEVSRDLNPNCPAVQGYLGRCYVAQKRYHAALLSFQIGGTKDEIEEVQSKWNRLFQFKHFGLFFKEALQGIRGRLHEMKVVEMRDIATSLVSEAVKNRRQEVLMLSQNLLNQAMQLFSTCLQHIHEKENIPDEFPVRRIAARQQSFEPSFVKPLLGQFKESDFPFYKFLKGYYQKEHQGIESFIHQANSEKHSQHGTQFLGSQTSITFDYRKKTQTTEVRPMFYDAATGKNPSNECEEIVTRIEYLIDTILTHLDGRASLAILEAITKDQKLANQVWQELIRMGWIDRDGGLKIETQEPLELNNFKKFENQIIDYLKNIFEYSKMTVNFETHFDLERQLLLGGNIFFPVLNMQNSPIGEIAAHHVQQASQLMANGEISKGIHILKQWAKWHLNSMPLKNLADNLWNNNRYFEALEVYRSIEHVDKAKQEFWIKRTKSWGDVAFQVEEAKGLLARLECISGKGSAEVLNLHAEIVAKLTHSLDHAMHAYCRNRYHLSQNYNALLLKEVFFPIASKEQKPEERVSQVFSFAEQLGQKMDLNDPFFKFLCEIQPHVNPHYQWLGILHEAINIEKHRRFLKCKLEDRALMEQNLKLRDLNFYRFAIQEIEKLHDKIASFSSENAKTY